MGKVVIANETLARAIVERLNALIVDPGVRGDVANLLQRGVTASHATIEHHDIVVTNAALVASELRFLGLVNGLLGGVRIAAAYDDNNVLVEFIVLDA